MGEVPLAAFRDAHELPANVNTRRSRHLCRNGVVAFGMSGRGDNAWAMEAMEGARDALSSFMEDRASVVRIGLVAEAVVDCFESGGKVLICGNGGSIADAMHFAEELTGRFRKERAALPALACTDAGHITCVANDYGYENVFSRWVE